jgi:hypothetical protein
MTDLKSTKNQLVDMRSYDYYLAIILAILFHQLNLVPVGDRVTCY